MDFVTVNLDWSYNYQGTTYGPGITSVPVGLAQALGLRAIADVQGEAPDPLKNGQGIALPPVRSLKAHLATLTTAEHVNALRALDDRSTAQPLYDARLAELEPEEEGDDDGEGEGDGAGEGEGGDGGGE